LFGGGFGDGAVKGGVGELTLSLCKVQVPAPDHDRATLISWLDHFFTVKCVMDSNSHFDC
jgi:hypothetical protein